MGKILKFVQKTGRFAAETTGLPSAARSVKRGSEVVRDLAATTKKLYMPDFENARHETFSDAVERLQVSDEDLRDRLFENRFVAYIYLAATIAAIAFAIYRNPTDFAVLTVHLAIAGAMATMFLSYSFFSWRIKNRFFCNYLIWLRRPENWFSGLRGPLKPGRVVPNEDD